MIAIGADAAEQPVERTSEKGHFLGNILVRPSGLGVTKRIWNIKHK